MSTGSYAINGDELTLQPTTGRWLPRTVIGIDGNGHSIYPPTYEFEMAWVLSDVSEFFEVLTDFDQVHITGTAVVDLPEYRSDRYYFVPYSGCVLHEPQMTRYFTEHTSQVKLLISNILA